MTKTTAELISESVEYLGTIVKSLKFYRKKSSRLYERLKPIDERLSKSSKVSSKVLQSVCFTVKEVSSFLLRFVESDYILKTWATNIDMERFFDLTKAVFECYELLGIPLPADQSNIELENAQDKKEDFEQLQKYLETVKGMDNLRMVALGLESQELRVIEAVALPAVNTPTDAQISEIRSKIEASENDIQGYETQNEAVFNTDFSQLECDRHHLNKIGEGKFGIVFKGQLYDSEVAVKYFRDITFSSEKLAALKKEIAKLHVLRHENIIKYFGAQSKTIPYYFVFERAYCSLYNALYARDESERLDLHKGNYRKKLEILIDCARAVQFLHNVNVLHRNIKSTNVLIMPNGTAKIADFSFAMTKQDINSSLVGTGGSVRGSISGTASLSAQKVFPAYLAPEIVLNSSKEPIEYNVFTDTYAFGVLINEVLTHTPPFPGLTFRNIMAKLQKSDNNRPQLFAQGYFSSNNLHMIQAQGNGLILELKNLIERAWSTNPADRPSFDHILLILERILVSADLLDSFYHLNPESNKTPLPSTDENESTTKVATLSNRKSFYRSYDSNDTGDQDMSASRDSLSPVKGSKIATIIESYEKGFGSQSFDRTYDRSFDRSMDQGDASMYVKSNDRFERSMDRSHDPTDGRSRSTIGLAPEGKSKTVSTDLSKNVMFEPAFLLPENNKEDASLAFTASKSSDDHSSNNNINPVSPTKPPLPPRDNLDLTSMGIAINNVPSRDSKISDISMELSRSSDHSTNPPPPTTTTTNYIDINQSRTIDSFDSQAPKPGGSLDSYDQALRKTRTLDSTDGAVYHGTELVSSQDPEYLLNKDIAQLFYDAGSCGKKDALLRLEALATENNLLALGFYMGMLCYGSGITKDNVKANDIAKRIYPMIIQHADNENNISRKFYQYIAGLCYEQGLGVTKNDHLAVKYYQLSADQGYAAALSNLGYCYKHGQGVKEDRYEAVRLYGLGADQNHATSLNNLGYCYQHGYGVHKDLVEAVRLYKKSADQGHSTAQNNLGYCYQYGQGCEKNLAEAVRLYELSASQGCSFGQNSLGHCYKRGHGVPKDYNKAVFYYRLAAEQGHATAQNNLGYCYQYGQGVEANYPEAVKWYKLSVEQGQASAENNLGFCFQCGIGVKKDLSQAVALYRSSAEKGYAVAMYNLGLCFLNGMGCPQDPEKGVQLIRNSAEQGHTAGQVKLAMCYEEGQGITKDSREAIRWYVMAARRGDETAMKALKRIHG